MTELKTANMSEQQGEFPVSKAYCIKPKPIRLPGSYERFLVMYWYNEEWIAAASPLDHSLDQANIHAKWIAENIPSARYIHFQQLRFDPKGT